MIVVKFINLFKKLFSRATGREHTTRQYTREMIKKYRKTLRKLSFE